MSGLMSQEIQNDFINELKGYIPALKQMAGSLETQTSGRDELTEMYRLVHTVKGASSLVKLPTLSNVASELETVIESLMEQRLAVNSTVCGAIQAALAYFDQYAPSPEDMSQENDRMQEVMAALKTAYRQAPDASGAAEGTDFPETTGMAHPGNDKYHALDMTDDDDPAIELTSDLAILSDEDLLSTDVLCEPPAVEMNDPDAEDDDGIELPDDELREGFYQEAEEHFHALGEALVALEGQVNGAVEVTAAHREHIGRIRRAVHTIKGAAAVIKLTEISGWGHAFEDVLDWLYESAGQIDPDMVALVAESADMLEQYVSDPGKVDAGQRRKLQDAFDRLIGTSPAPSALPLSDDVLLADDAPGFDAVDDEPCADDDDLFELPDDELREGFYQEAEEHFHALGEALIALEGQVNGAVAITSAHREHIGRIRRAVHTIKGAAAVIKLNEISGWGHAFEDVLDWLYETAGEIDPDTVALVAESADMLEQYVSDPGKVDAGQRRKLQDAFDRLIGASPAPSDPPLSDGVLLADDEPGFDADTEALYTDDDIFELPEEELREGFFQEAEEHFHALGEALVALEGQVNGAVEVTSAHREHIGRIRRAVHTIKGAAAVIKLTEISGWGHAFEDVLDWLYETAGQIDPDTVALVAESADLLEQYVSDPAKVDGDRRRKLQDAFDRLIGALPAPSDPPLPEDILPTDDAHSFDAEIVLNPIIAPGPVAADTPSNPETAASAEGRTGTLRVETAKIEGLVNLAGELIVALSAFDDNMNGLGDVIIELEQSRQRLKTTTRDLEVGYEVKAIQHLGTHLSQVPALTGPGDGLPGEFDDFDLLELDRYSEFNLLIRSLNETTVDVNTISTQLSDVHSGFGAYLNRLRVLTKELQEKVMRIRMTPMSSITHRLHQTVRQTARALGKNVRMVVSGEEIELDKQVWEKLSDPLMHILRNAVDHGIESPAQRAAVGKPDLATIQLSAAYQGNQVILRIADDGAGLNYSTIRQKALLLDAATPVDRMSEDELAELIFLQGFSTRDQVSDISGRGVGMDVVRQNIAALKGNVQIEHTAPGSGTTFMIRMPLTLAVMRALIFRVNNRLYATALHGIKEMLRIHPRDLMEDNGKTFLKLGERQIPFYALSKILAAGPASAAPIGDAAQRQLVLVIDTGTWQGAVAIDSMQTQREIVIKSLGAHLQQVRGISGATIMGDGTVVPILNLEELLSTAPLYRPQRSAHAPEQLNMAWNILVVDDSVSVRTVVSRLMQRQGWHVKTANDGVDALEKLREHRPDIILLDVEMPRMNGYEFMSALRSQDEFKRLPVIMLTSRSAQKHRDKALQLGVNGYMIKPYEDEVLVGLVQKLITQA